MAIQFARIEILSRGKGGNACCKAAYNAKTKVVDQRTGQVFDFSGNKTLAYHEMLLPGHVDLKFRNVSVFSNEIERFEKQKNSQLAKDVVIALPDDKEIDLQDKINITKEIIEEMGWVKEGLGVQMDIHAPDRDDKNWHVHLLVTTRRFTEDGKTFSSNKARDLNPEFKCAKGGKGFVIKEEEIIHEKGKRIMNDYFERKDLDLRVDLISTVPQEHIGPVRMRSMMNSAADRNEIRKIRHLENISNAALLLESVTRRQSVFAKKDLEAAVKELPDEELRVSLVKEALEAKEVLRLYEKEPKESNGNEAGKEYFTTRSVRLEEERIMRIANVINEFENITALPEVRNSIKFNRERNKTEVAIQKGDKEERGGYSEEQATALEHLLCGQGGMRILLGRAGTGKSHVLGEVSRLAGSAGVRVVGLSPTNKAAVELGGKGFAESYTVKWFLFALKNNRINLAKNSLVVLDEAGMLGNSDLQELVQVVRGHKCNLIMAGDDRQLTSVERGGLFEVLAKEFGSVTLSQIKRQTETLGRQMAEHFSRGEMLQGLKILEGQKRIFAAETCEGSILELLSHWGASSFEIKNRLMITVTNKDVDALNEGAREYLKQIGHLEGEKISIERREKVGEMWVDIRREFMAGDRVLFTANNRVLKVQNGDFGTIIKVSKNEFKVELDREIRGENSEQNKNKYVTFNPAEIEGLKYGYAVTTYKSQAASIKDVYNLHSGVGNMRSGYVNLTRHIDSLKLFYNLGNTRSLEHLAEQLSKLDEKSSSLHYATREDLTKELEQELREFLEQGEESILSKAASWLKNTATKFGDRLHSNPFYYKFDEPEQGVARVEEVLEEVYEVVQESFGLAQVSPANDRLCEELTIAASGGSMATAGVKVLGRQIQPRLTEKQRFYKEVDRNRNQQQRQHQNKMYKEVRDYAAELDSLRNVMSRGYDRIALDLLGSPNNKLSGGKTLKYGSKGSMVVSISGQKAGTWYDFEAGEGGDIISLVQRERGLDFKGAADYLKSFFGVSKQASLRIVHDNEVSAKYSKAVEQDYKEEQKHAKDQIKVGSLYAKSKNISTQTVASRYLKEERKIGLPVEEGSDLRTIGIWDRDKQKRYPAIVAFARNKQGEITGGQQIMLDPDTAKKAEVNVAKKSFGGLKGSFVEVQKGIDKIDKIDKNNITLIAEGLETALSIKEAGLGERVLCSLGISNIKNYQPDPGERVLLCADNDGEHSKTHETLNRARDSLVEAGAIVQIIAPKEVGDFNDLLKRSGKSAVKEILEPAIESLRLELAPEEKLRSRLAEELLMSQESILAEIKRFGGEFNHSSLVTSLSVLDQKAGLQYIKDLRDRVMEKALKNQLHKFGLEKMSVFTLKELQPIVSKEQGYLQEVYKTKAQEIENYPLEMSKYLRAGQEAQDHPEKLAESFKEGQLLVREGFEREIEAVKLLHSATNAELLLSKVRQRKEYHWRRTKLPRLEVAIKSAKTSAEALKAIEQRENFLASLHGNLKHSGFDEEFTTSVANAHENIENNTISKLKEAVGEHLKEGITSEKDITQLLQNTKSTDMRQTYYSLDKAIESHQINQTLDNFREELKATKTSEKAMEVLEQREVYLTDLHDHLKYQNHEEPLKQMIEAAKTGVSDQQKDLREVVQHTTHNGIMREEQLLKSLQGAGSLKSAHQHLVNACQDHHVSCVKQNLSKIAENQIIEIDNKKFDCPAKYLEHEISHPAHKYADIPQITRLQKQLQNQLEFNQQMHGPRL